MLIMAIIGALVPTLFYQMFGSVNVSICVSHHLGLTFVYLYYSLSFDALVAPIMLRMVVVLLVLGVTLIK